jgi:hypothetical protein
MLLVNYFIVFKLARTKHENALKNEDSTQAI